MQTVCVQIWVCVLCLHLSMWLYYACGCLWHISVHVHCVSMYMCVNVSTMCVYVSVWVYCACVWVYVYAYVYMWACVCVYVSLARGWQLSSAVTSGLTCDLMQGNKWERGRAVFFSACIFPFFVFIKHWLLILEVEHCHKKPFAVNKAVAAAWGVNTRPGKPCENHLSAIFPKWVRRKGKMGHPGSSILVPHTGQGSPFPTGIGVMCGCAQLLGHRPTVCTSARQKSLLPAAAKTLDRPSGRPGCSVPGPSDCSLQAWPHSRWRGHQCYDFTSLKVWSASDWEADHKEIEWWQVFEI